MPVPNNFDPSCCGDLGTKTETVFGGSGKTTKTVCKTGDEDKNDDGGGDDAACFDSIWQKTRKTFCQGMLLVRQERVTDKVIN